MNKVYVIFCILLLSACNSVSIKPNSLDKTQVFYVDRGGYTMRREIKDVLENRGYRVLVGRAKSSNAVSGEESIDMDTFVVPSNARYIVRVRERSESFYPFWCVFNGFWWWNFNVSIADQSTQHELLSWRGRGCANSSLRKLNDILDEMEQ